MRRSTYMSQGNSNSQSLAGGKKARGAPAHTKTRASPDTVCQRCLGRGHFLFECKAPEVSYKPRPTRTQQLLNSKKAPKLLEEASGSEVKKSVQESTLVAILSPECSVLQGWNGCQNIGRQGKVTQAQRVNVSAPSNTYAYYLGSSSH